MAVKDRDNDREDDREENELEQQESGTESDAEANKKKGIREEDAEDDDGEESEEVGKKAAADGEEADGEDGEDAEERRQRRREERQRRKQWQRERAERDRRLIESQNRTIQELNRRLEGVEGRVSGHEIIQVDRAIGDLETIVASQKERMAEAVKNGDGDAHQRAQEQWFDARQRLESLRTLKNRMGNGGQAGAQRSPGGIDPMVQNYATGWMSANRWYDPNATDVDSRVVLAIDSSLAQEGYNPRTREYWDELTRRSRQYLPHRFGRKAENDDGDGRGSRRKGPPTGGSGRNNASGGTEDFNLSKERIEALKMAGKWEDSAKRKAAIEEFKKYDAAARASS